jgi:hypothetical protein
LLFISPYRVAGFLTQHQPVFTLKLCRPVGRL